MILPDEQIGFGLFDDGNGAVNARQTRINHFQFTCSIFISSYLANI